MTSTRDEILLYLGSHGGYLRGHRNETVTDELVARLHRTTSSVSQALRRLVAEGGLKRRGTRTSIEWIALPGVTVPDITEPDQVREPDQADIDRQRITDIFARAKRLPEVPEPPESTLPEMSGNIRLFEQASIEVEDVVERWVLQHKDGAESVLELVAEFRKLQTCYIDLVDEVGRWRAGAQAK